MQFVARRFDAHQPARFEIHQGRIDRIEPLDHVPLEPNRESLPWVAPGFLDIQINGYGGQEFSSLDLTPDRVCDIVRGQRRFGVTRLCPTLTTQSPEVLAHGLRAIAQACELDRDVKGSIAGIHVEGPFISPDDGPRGAHPLEHCRPPDWNLFARLQEAAAGRIRLLTLSPEYDQAPEFIARATAAGVVIAIGHTSATGDQIRRAVDAGATLSTHLGNGAHRMLRRHPNYLWDQLADDRLHASLIVDGHHLPPEVVKTFVRAKGPQRIVLVSDLSGLAGLPVGRYLSSGCELEILPDGRLVIAGQDQLLAGASLPLTAGIANVMRFAEVSLADAIAMVTCNPAQLLRLESHNWCVGQRADLVLFDTDQASPPGLQVRATICRGELVHGELPHAGC